MSKHFRKDVSALLSWDRTTQDVILESWFSKLKPTEFFMLFPPSLTAPSNSCPCEWSFISLAWHGDATIWSSRSTFSAIYAAHTCCVPNITTLLKNDKSFIFHQIVAHSLWNTYIQTDSIFSSLPLGSDIGPLYLLFSNSLRQVVWLQPSTGSVNVIINGLPPFNSPAFFTVFPPAHCSSPIAQLATLSRVLLVAFSCDCKDIELEGKQSGDSSHRRKIW